MERARTWQSGEGSGKEGEEEPERALVLGLPLVLPKAHSAPPQPAPSGLEGLREAA